MRFAGWLLWCALASKVSFSTTNGSIQCAGPEGFGAYQDGAGLAQFTDPSAAYHRVYRPVMEAWDAHRKITGKHVAAVKSLPRGAKVLDVGGGFGIHRDRCLAERPDLDYHIRDLSPESRAVGIAYGAPESHVKEGDATNLHDIASGSQDHVVSDKMLYLLNPDQVKQFFQEAHRVLKPGGTFSLSSMMDVEPMVMQNFFKHMTADLLALERDGKVPPESATIFLEANKVLTDRNRKKDPPSVFRLNQIREIGEKYGFEMLSGDEEGYDGTCFFVNFRKR